MDRWWYFFYFFEEWGFCDFIRVKVLLEVWSFFFYLRILILVKVLGLVRVIWWCIFIGRVFLVFRFSN